MCRPATNLCDVPEYCNGTNEEVRRFMYVCLFVVMLFDFFLRETSCECKICSEAVETCLPATSNNIKQRQTGQYHVVGMTYLHKLLC